MTGFDFGEEEDSKIKVALVDDHVLFRQGLRLVLDNFADVEVIFEVNHGKELIEKLVDGEPDVILMDINMPVMNGIKTTRLLRRHFPRIKVIVLTVHDEKKLVVEMIKNGANGYLSKNTEPKELYSAITRVIRAGFYCNAYMTKRMFKS